jgi:hypothetical protein
MSKLIFIQTAEGFKNMSYEDLKELEYNYAYNPFDTTGLGNTEEEFLEELISQSEEAIEYYSQFEQSSSEN